jgi:hypothetical protein
VSSKSVVKRNTSTIISIKKAVMNREIMLSNVLKAVKKPPVKMAIVGSSNGKRNVVMQ